MDRAETEPDRLAPDEAAAARCLSRARHAVALTGAGISVESGIPDFRSPGGLWAVFDPFEYATLSCFLADPEKAWRMYRALARAVAGKAPNPAHRALAELEGTGRLTGIVTQNVDGLHQVAGSRRVLEIHGDCVALQCLRCGTHEPFPTSALDDGPIPRCDACGSALKPNVVLFEEPVRSLAAIDALLRPCDLLLVVGTSANVAPAALIPDMVRARGGLLVEFNLERCLPADVHVLGPAGVTLPRVAAALRARVVGEPR